MENMNALIWLKNGITALAIAGLYSIILVILRTPQLSHFFSDQSIFRSALVIHVNLSVLVWLLAITCCIWSISSIKTGLELLLARTAFIGMILMACSPLYPESEAIMNNYVPILENIIFIIGLSLFGTVVLILSIQTMITSFIQEILNYGQRIIAITKFTSSFMFICVWICFVISFVNLNELSDIVPLDIDFYYETLFWSGGHLLQFIYTQILMLVLLVFAESWRGGRVSYSSVYEMLLALNFVLSLAVFIGHYRYGIADGSFKEFYTLHMIYTGGLVPTIFIATLLLEILQKRAASVPNFVKVSFVASILLFLFGGAIGAVISGVNVTIPAHYHGTIVGISVAFMGLSYMFCFKQDIYLNIIELGGVINIFFSTEYKNSADGYGKKMATWQVTILTFGQLLHITGLFLAGGYGVLRKTPGSEMALSAKLYMGMVGGGGLIAIIGGLIFVYICVINLYSFKVK